MNLSLLFQNRTFRWVFGIHVAVIGALLIAPLFHRHPKEIVHFVEFVSEQPPPVEQPVVQPNPVVEKPVVEAPMPTNKPPEIAEKPKPKAKPKPKPVQRQTTRVTRQATPARSAQKHITASDIRKALGAGGTADPHGAYYQTIFARFYAVWQVPVGAAYGLSAQGVITLGADGTLLSRKLTRPSGDAAFDQSVQKALNAIKRLPAPPADLPSRTITVEFVPQ